ncbi:hypothetical protein [Paraburkholderia terricola]|nr:hypothetical protein [Paraburkholderia terricola]
MNLAMPISEWMDKRTGSAARQSRWMSLTAQLENDADDALINERPA